MTRLEQTLDGKELPKNVALYRDENTGALEVRFWRFQPMLLFMIPFMCVWTYFSVGKMYVEPFLAGQPIRNASFGIPFVLGALFFWGVGLPLPFGQGQSAVCIRNGYRSVRICHGWSSDAINFVCAMICQRKA